MPVDERTRRALDLIYGFTTAAEGEVFNSRNRLVPAGNVNDFLPAKKEVRISPEHDYANTQEFRALVSKAQTQGIDSLTKSQQQQVQKAIDLGLIPEDAIQQPQASREQQSFELNPMIAFLSELGQEVALNADKPQSEQLRNYAIAFGTGLDDMISKSVGKKFGTSGMMGLKPTEVIAKGLDLAGLEMIMPGEMIPNYDYNYDKTYPKKGKKPWGAKELVESGYFGEIEGRVLPYRIATTGEAIAYNLAMGAVRLAPELIASFAENPYEFFKGLVTFPVHEVKLILDALPMGMTGAIRMPEAPFINYNLLTGKTEEDITKARDELISNPIGVAMLGMMALGVGRGLAKKGKIQSDYTTVRNSELANIIDQSQKFKEAAEKSAIKEKLVGEIYQKKLAERLNRDQRRESILPDIEPDQVAQAVKDMSTAALNNEIVKLRPDLSTQVIAGLDRPTREAIILGEEAHIRANKIAKPEEVIKSEKVQEPIPEVKSELQLLQEQKLDKVQAIHEKIANENTAPFSEALKSGEENGLIYDGLWENPKGDPKYAFTFPETKDMKATSIVVDNLSELAEKKAETVAKFTKPQEKTPVEQAGETGKKFKNAEDLKNKPKEAEQFSAYNIGDPVSINLEGSRYNGKKGKIVGTNKDGFQVEIASTKDVVPVTADVLKKWETKSKGFREPLLVNDINKGILEGIKAAADEGGLNIKEPIYRPEDLRDIKDGRRSPEDVEPISYKSKSDTHPALFDKFESLDALSSALDRAIKGVKLTEKQADLVKYSYREWLDWHKQQGALTGERVLVDLDLKPTDEIKINGDWYRVTKRSKDGELTLQDGKTIHVDEVFSRIDVDETVKGVPIIRRQVDIGNTNVKKPGDIDGMGNVVDRKATNKDFGIEETPIYDKGKKGELDQGVIPGTGKEVEVPENQGDVFSPDKIKTGNLTQDQVGLFGAGMKTKEDLKKAINDFIKFEKDQNKHLTIEGISENAPDIVKSEYNRLKNELEKQKKLSKAIASEFVTEQPRKADFVNTGNESADIIRNIAHHKREFNENTEFLKRNDIPDNLRREIENRQELLTEQITEFEKQRDDIADNMRRETKNTVVPLGMKKSMEPEAGKIVSIRDIRKYMESNFGVPIRSGKVQSKIAAGIYKVFPQIIRLKDYKDVESMTHEVAHHIDETYSGIKDLRKRDKELVKLDYNYPNEGRSSEGFAEYMRAYLTETADVNKIAPNFTNKFNDFLELNPVLKDKIHSLKALVDRWAKQGAYDRTLSQMVIDKLPDKSSIGEFGTKWYRRGRSAWVGDLSFLETAENMIRGTKNVLKDIREGKVDPATSATATAYDVAKRGKAKARSMVLRGTFNRAGETTGISLQKVLEPVTKTPENLRDFLVYAYSRRTIDLAKRGINSGLGLADAKYNVEKLRTLQLDETLSDLTAFQNRVMDYAIESGALDKQSAAMIRARNPIYIPLKRVFDEVMFGRGGSGSSFANVSKPIKSFTKGGSGRMIKNILESVIENTAKIINTSDRIVVGQRLVDLARNTPGAGWVAEKLPPAKMAIQVKMEDALKQIFDKLDMDAKEFGLKDMELDEVLTFYHNSPFTTSAEPILNFWRKGGERESWQLEPELYKSLKGVDPIQHNAFFKLMGHPARGVRLGATGLRVGFSWITNPIRDAFTFLTQSEFTSGSPHHILKGYMKQFSPGNEYKLMWERSGGDMSNYLGVDRNYLKTAVDEVLANDLKSKSLNIVKHPIELLKEILSIPESAPRLAEFAAAHDEGLKLGYSKEGARILASLASSDVTVNFGRMGTLASSVNQLIPFFNAQIQGLSRFNRFMQEHPVKGAVKALVYITAPTLALWEINRDQKWYKEMPAWQKYGFWNFNLGLNQDGSPKILKLPKPFEWGTVFSSEPEALWNYFYNKNSSDFGEAQRNIGTQVLPDYIPQGLKMVIEQNANYDFFRDKNIDPYYEVKYKEPKDRFGPYTTETSKFIGKQFGLSPRRIDHLISSSTGGLGMDVVRALEGKMGFDVKSSSELPIVGRLFQPTLTHEQRQKNLEYRKTEEKAKINAMIKKGRVTEALRKMNEWNNKYPEFIITLD